MAETGVTETLDRVLDDIGQARHYNHWVFERARPYLGTRVLDAGAGIGTFVELALAAGAEVTALEPDAVFAARLRERFSDNVEVVQAPADALPPILRGFDSILCLNVLEHVERDLDALRSFRGALGPGGRLLLLVPAHPWLYGGYDRAAGHLRRYGAEPLRALLEASGLEVETLRHVNPLGALGWLVRVRLRRGMEWPSTSFRTFDRLVPVVRHLDGLRLPLGLSLWAVARVPTGV